jgi:hypothetical protein
VLASGVTLIENEVLYDSSSRAWTYARHLVSIWQTYKGYALPPNEKGDYDFFFADVARALRGCDPGCTISDLEIAQTKSDLLGAL